MTISTSTAMLTRAAFRLTFGASGMLLAGCDSPQPFEPAASRDPDVLAVRAVSSFTAPSSTTAAASSSSQINIGWQDNSTNESGYEVHRSTTGSSGTFILLVKLGVDAAAHGDAALAAATSYCYKVRAVRANGKNVSYSAFSNTACATTLPAPPAAASAADATPGSSIAVEVTFKDNSTNEDGFRVYRSIDGGTAWTLAGTLGPYSRDYFVDFPLTAEQRVCYRVVAYNSGGEATPSNSDCTTPPAAPTDLEFAVDQTGTARVTWTDNSGVEDGYELWGRYSNVIMIPCSEDDPEQGECEYISITERLIASLPPNSTSTDYRCDCGTLFEVRVLAKKDGGSSTWVFKSQ